MFNSQIDSPLGKLIIKANNEAVFCIGFEDSPIDEVPNTITEKASFELGEYFQGIRNQFTFVFKQNGTDFQQTVWSKLLTIEAGKPISYLILSKKMKNHLAIRAIASANGKNKIMIVIPCHRVIGSNGNLVGYSGGLWRKKWLLEHEARMMKTGQTTLTLH